MISDTLAPYFCHCEACPPSLVIAVSQSPECCEPFYIIIAVSRSPEPFASCRSEHSEESRGTQGRLHEGEESGSAQGKLREGGSAAISGKQNSKIKRQKQSAVT